MSGWIGVDLDGTLAEYHGWEGEDVIGPPIPAMLARVKGWLDAGQEVRILTARAGSLAGREATRSWVIRHLGKPLKITDRKDYKMFELWDDRAVRVRKNEGVPCCAHAAEG